MQEFNERTLKFSLLFPAEKESEILEVRRNMQQEIQTMERANQQLKIELETEKGLLIKARSGLEAAQQLNLQIEEKSRLVTQLRNQGKPIALTSHCTILTFFASTCAFEV